MAALFKIGDFDFIDLSRAPSRSLTRTVREVRPGASGVTLHRMGSQPAPYSLVSVRDVADVETGLDLYAEYEDAVGSDPVTLIWAGVDKGLVYIHNVLPLDEGIYATLLGIGGLEGTSNGMVRAAWTLEWAGLTQ
jgi:hypothetical protein